MPGAEQGRYWFRGQVQPRTPKETGRSVSTYIAGPMTGLPEFNYPAFAAAAKVLRDKGVDAVSPAELDDGSTGKSWDYYMRLGLRALLDCDEMVLLPGWEDSRGARLERQVAEALGMRITEWVAA